MKSKWGFSVCVTLHNAIRQLCMGVFSPSMGVFSQLFSLFGPVSDAVVLRDRASNRHKGCAFVRMSSLAGADRAIRELQNLDPVRFASLCLSEAFKAV